MHDRLIIGHAMDIHSILFLVLCHCWPLSFAARHQDENDGWEDWKKRNNVVIPFQAVDNFRRNIWAQNKAAVEAHNSQGRRRFGMELDEMAPLTPEEYAAFRLGAIIPSSEEGRRGRKPTSQRRLDYRTLGYVTRVKNQGWCGSCWAFSTTGSIEGQYFNKTGQLISLSEQHLVDCSRARGFSYGCYGGWMGRAMQFVKNYGIHLEENYPYVFWHRQCKQDRGPVATKIKSHVRVRNDEDALADALREVGPISVAVNAGRSSFRFYKSGIYDDDSCSTTYLNHAVLLVGYGFEKGDHYWIIKNSWGTGWGEGGYMRMIRDGRNICGIANYAMYPVI